MKNIDYEQMAIEFDKHYTTKLSKYVGMEYDAYMVPIQIVKYWIKCIQKIYRTEYGMRDAIYESIKSNLFKALVPLNWEQVGNGGVIKKVYKDIQ